MSDDLGLLPAKPLSNFSKRKGNKDSIALGNESDKWEEEEACVMDTLTVQLAADTAADEADFFTNATNLRAASDGTGSGKGVFYDFVPFDVMEIHKLISVLFEWPDSKATD